MQTIRTAGVEGQDGVTVEVAIGLRLGYECRVRVFRRVWGAYVLCI